MRRAAAPLPANIVEGTIRRSRNEYLQFVCIAVSPLAELSCHIRLTKEIEYLRDNRYEALWEKRQESLLTLEGLISYVEKSGVHAKGLPPR